MRWPGENRTCQTSQNPDGYKLILVFLEKKGYKKDALDRRLLANRRYEALACGRLVLGQGGKVLSGSTQGNYPRHNGS